MITRPVLRALVVTIPWLVLAGVAATQPPPPPPARPIPGITALDQFPRACVDCHVRRPDIGLDPRISTLMKEWTEQVNSKLLA